MTKHQLFLIYGTGKHIAFDTVEETLREFDSTEKARKQDELL